MRIFKKINIMENHDSKFFFMAILFLVFHFLDSAFYTKFLL